MELTDGQIFDLMSSAAAQFLADMQSTLANNGKSGLFTFLKRHNLEILLPADMNPFGKVIIIGAATGKLNSSKIKGIVSDFGIGKDRVETYLEYGDIKWDHIKSAIHSFGYSLIICGPEPHSTQGKGHYGSSIEAILNESTYPKVIKAVNSKGKLELSRTSLENTLEQALLDGNICED